VISNHLGLLVDKADGKFEGQMFYDDTDVEQMNSIPETQIHRNVDLLVVEADKEGEHVNLRAMYSPD